MGQSSGGGTGCHVIRQSPTHQNTDGLSIGRSRFGSANVIFVEGDRFTVKYLRIDGTKAQEYSINQSALTKVGQVLVFYNWNATAQGSIPHDLIRDIACIGSNKFEGTYIRTRYPRVATVKFYLRLTVRPPNISSVFSIENEYILNNLIFKTTATTKVK